jgi:hypothetical protein
MDDNIKNVGFAIKTSDEYVIESNAYEMFDGKELSSKDWEDLNEDIGIIERNVLKYLDEKIQSVSDEGHGSDDALIGTAWYDADNSEQVDFVMERSLQAQNTDSDYFPELYEGVSEMGSELVDVYIEFFDIPDEDYEAWEDAQ